MIEEFLLLKDAKLRQETIYYSLSSKNHGI